MFFLALLLACTGPTVDTVDTAETEDSPPIDDPVVVNNLVPDPALLAPEKCPAPFTHEPGDCRLDGTDECTANANCTSGENDVCRSRWPDKCECLYQECTKAVDCPGVGCLCDSLTSYVLANTCASETNSKCSSGTDCESGICLADRLKFGCPAGEVLGYQCATSGDTCRSDEHCETFNDECMYDAAVEHFTCQEPGIVTCE